MDGIPERTARYSSLIITYLITLCMFIQRLCVATTVQVVIPNESLSSPKTIVAIKGSSVQLYWNYTLDARFVPLVFTFVKQTCSVNETMNNKITTVAEKASQNGQLIVSSSLSSSLSGRCDVISSNNRLVLNNIGYNDTWNHFYSDVFMKAAGTTTFIKYGLKPFVVRITVEGAPTFIAKPAKSFEVAENGEITITADFDGNPIPTAEIEFPHFGTKTQMTVRMVYPFIYRADYVIKPVLASHCGRTVVTRMKNKIGEIEETSTINVILTISDPSVLAGKSSQDCVEVEWQKKESGACNVTYQVNYKTADGMVQFTDTVINKAKVQRCGIASSVNITDVELKINSTKSNVVFSASVSQKPIPPPTKVTTTKKVTITKESSTPTTFKSIKSASNAFTATVTKSETTGCESFKTATHVGYGLTIFILLLVVAVLTTIIFKYRRKKDEGKTVQFSDVKRNTNIEEMAAKESNYSELYPNNREYEHIYTGLTKSKENKPNEKDVEYSNISVVKF